MTITDVMHTQLAFKVRGNMRNLHPTQMPLWSLVKGIQDNRQLAELTARGRQILATEGEAAFKAWKPKNLMSVYFAAKFRDNQGSPETENVAGYTGLAGFDFDDVDAAATLQALRGVPQVACAGVSASGRGVWCCALVAAATAQEYALCFSDGIAAFRAAGLSGLDIGAHDPTRARFVAACPECWWRYEVDDIPAFQPVGDLSLLGSGKKRKADKTKLPKGYTISPELAMDEVRTILSRAAEVADGDRNTEKARMCGEIKAVAKRAGVKPAAYYQTFLDTWDATGSTPKKTRSVANRLLIGKD